MKNNKNKTKKNKISREEKRALKLESRTNKASKFKNSDPTVSVGFKTNLDSKTKSKLFQNKNKKEEKVPFKTSLKEFPIKMVRDVNRIKWISKAALGKRFIAVLIFIISFALAYAAVDQILLAIFKAIKVI